jgi:hypothetical protein
VAIASASAAWLSGDDMYCASRAFVPNPISTSTAGMYAVTNTRKPACFTPRLGPGCIPPSRS